MCNHHLLLEWIHPSGNWRQNEEISDLPLDGGIGDRVSASSLAAGLAKTQHLAAIYTLAHPERAAQLKLARYSCHGHVEDFAALPEDLPSPQQLARELLAQRETLAFYASPSGWTPKTYQSQLLEPAAVLTDQGQRAQAALFAAPAAAVPAADETTTEAEAGR